ncbi:subtilisin-like protease SBT3.17 [Nicotiana sylvestris]|uniref:subtilisin-like protease SBT3.17 n=1 Tax=Nicotiana sylvestris TaxID=4096 RepID=UPI00388C5F16
MKKTQIICSILLVFSFVAATISIPDSQAKVYIVHTENPEDQDPEEFHIKILASVLGSEDAAKEALIYSYKHAASGFSAKLTPEQVSELEKKREVLQIVPSRTLQIHGIEHM